MIQLVLLIFQELIKYAAKMLQILMKPASSQAAGFRAGAVLREEDVAEKRNSGMVDAVIHMPDLFNVGK